MKNKNVEIVELNYKEAVKGINHEMLEKVTSEWYDYVMGLPENYKITYLAVILNNQIYNGGFQQYFYNGYGQFASETINVLNRIGAPKKAGLLKQAIDAVNVNQYPDDLFREKILKRELENLWDEKEDDIIDKLDDLYYEADNADEETIALLTNFLTNYRQN
jgi:hypothetical protein